MKFLALCLFAVLATAAAAAPREFGAPANLADLRSRLPLDGAACDRLRRDGFVVLGDRSVRGLHNAYPKSPTDAFVLVTTDALLQLWHDLYLNVSEAAEERGLLPSLRAAVGPMARSCAALLSSKRTSAARRR